ncbi:MAG: hypothetical protein CSB55_06610 [Candidatus Cloacimonadota bacterium]|nr:MAG: hypothetical protein CSB55_06610 [Candidatus Cloacimonadota bacterium]
MNKLAISALLMFCFSLSSETIKPERLFHQVYKVPTLLNPNKIKMSQSVSFTSSFDSRNNSFYQSRYTNSIEYKFNPKLKMNLNLHFVNDGTATWSRNFHVEGNGDNENRVLPEFSIEYKPSENSKIIFEFQQGGIYRRSDNFFWRSE